MPICEFMLKNTRFSVLKVGGWVRGSREVGGRGYFGWMGGFGPLGGWVGVVKSEGSVERCVTWPCDLSLERV